MRLHGSLYAGASSVDNDDFPVNAENENPSIFIVNDYPYKRSEITPIEVIFCHLLLLSLLPLLVALLV